MFIYSKKIIHFMNESKKILKDILSREIGLRVFGDRFYDQAQKNSYPIRLVVYNNKNMLGYFDSSFYEIGLNECLMLLKKEQLQNVIRHELAHYITFIKYGAGIAPHGQEFKEFCEQIGFSEEVCKASVCLEEIDSHAQIEENGVLRKVKKLMALATSDNENEREQAMIKSQQLLLKHNIEAKYVVGDDNEKIFLKRIIKQKKKDAKMRAIAHILETFFVNVVYNRSGEFIYLEIVGNAVNIEIAEYVASFLQSELDNLWTRAKHSANLKGMIAKNSFFLGLAKGYCNKIQSLKREYNDYTVSALLVIEKQLIDANAMVYKRLYSTKSMANFCHKSSLLGEKMGRALNINPAIYKSNNSEVHLLYHS